MSARSGRPAPSGEEVMSSGSSPGPTEIYLDNNATTRVLHVAADAARSAMEYVYGNPSSSHITGLRARHILELTRRRAAKVLGAGDGRIVFTSGATEAIQMAILSALCEAAEARKRGGSATTGRVLLYGATEHKAVPEALRHWSRLLDVAEDVVAIPVDTRGILDIGFIREHAPRADMICTMAVNNETGVIQDLPAIEEAIRSVAPRTRWLVDCVQAVGKQTLALAETTVDYAAVSGHKLYAPKGVGILYVRAGTPVTPLIAGGGQEAGARSGTENLPGVAALGAIFGCLLDDVDDTFRAHDVQCTFRDRLAASLKKAFPGIVFNADFADTVPTTINFAVKNLSSKEILDLFDAAGIRVSSGSACGSAIQGSYVLEAMGLPAWQCEGAIRLSFGPATRESEIAEACAMIEEAGEALRGACVLVADDIEETSRGERRPGVVQLKRGSNCTWLHVAADGTCVIVDPVADLADRVETFVRCQSCQVVAVLDTHAHNDRPPCRKMLIEVLGERARAARTRDPLGWPDDSATTLTLADGTEAEAIRIGDQTLLARTPLPGHTVEGRAYLLGELTGDKLLPADVRFAFCGDTVLIGGIGRTDFQVSVVAMLYDSLRRLDAIIAPHTVICPTHDYTNDFCTTLAAEKRGAGLLPRVLDPLAPVPRDDFVETMREMNTAIDDHPSELICGLIDVSDHADSSMNVGPEELADFFRRHADSTLVDVRELHESRFFSDWSSLGVTTPPMKVPLTRFTDFVGEMLRERLSGEAHEVICVCRSGSRSGRAAAVLRRLGISSSWHIAGGLAACAPGVRGLAPTA